MAWYYGTFSCGHEGRVNIVGPVKDRQWKADRKFEGMCENCYEKFLQEQRDRANAEAAEKAKEMELPELQGTEKQIAWANTIRQRFIELFDKIDEKYLEMARIRYNENEELKKIKLEDIEIIKDYMLANIKAASWYIDRRDRIFSAIIECSKEALKTDEQKVEEKRAIDIKLESTVYPENKITDGIVEIKVFEEKIEVIFEKNDKFREIVKNLRYSWNGRWERKINELTGSAEDRAAELGNKLLNAGFPICILNEKIREKAVKGEYEQECDRWIMLRNEGDYAGRLAITWYDKSNIYDKARKLPSSKWDKPSVIVKIEYYKEVEEFAELYSFKFTSKARKAIDEYIKKLQNVEIVNPIVVDKEQPKDGLQEILNSGCDILDDLKD